MIVGIPVINAFDLTTRCLEFLDNSLLPGDDVTVVIIDNGSQPPYRYDKFENHVFKLDLISMRENSGYYMPMRLLAETYPEEDIIGLIHNDVFIYEKGWVSRLKQAFELDDKISMIGFCGSNEVDHLGGRGTGTVMNFDGSEGQLPEHTGRVFSGFEYTCILDSLAMFIKTEDVPLLEIQDDIAPCHFYDRIWPLRLIEKGKKIGYLGVLIDHVGGMTESNEPLYDKMAEEWCKKFNVPFTPGDGNMSIYREAENRYLREFAIDKGMIPGRVDENGNFSMVDLFDVNKHIGYING